MKNLIFFIVYLDLTCRYNVSVAGSAEVTPLIKKVHSFIIINNQNDLVVVKQAAQIVARNVFFPLFYLLRV